MSDLTKKAVSSGKWAMLKQLTTQAVQFIVGIILARILQPEEFGLLAMVVVFTSLASVLANSGFRDAVIQKKSLSDIDRTTAFWLNLLLAVIMMVSLFFGGKHIAAFYGEHRLENIVKALTLVVFLRSLGGAHLAYAERTMQFKKLFVFNYLPVLVFNVIVSISLAVSGYGVWALVIPQILAAGLESAIFWIQFSWRPGWILSAQSAKEMFKFGSNLTLATFIDKVFQNIYVLVIGKMFSPLQLSFYQKAFSLQRLPSAQIYRVIDRVTFPIMSSIQDDKERMRKGFLIALTLIGLVNIPLFISLSVVAPTFIPFLLGDNWNDSISYFQLLCVIGCLWPIQAMNMSVLRAKGRSDLLLRLELVKKALTVIALVVTVKHGITVMIYGQVSIALISLVINSHYTKQFLEVGFKKQMETFMPFILTSGAVAAVLYFTEAYLSGFMSPLLAFPILLLVGAALYISIIRAISYNNKEKLREIFSKNTSSARLINKVFFA